MNMIQKLLLNETIHYKSLRSDCKSIHPSFFIEKSDNQSNRLTKIINRFKTLPFTKRSETDPGVKNRLADLALAMNRK